MDFCFLIQHDHWNFENLTLSRVEMNSGRRTARQEEEYHVFRRNAEMRKQEHWTNVAEYFKTWDVKASKYAAWTSPRYFKQRFVLFIGVYYFF